MAEILTEQELLIFIQLGLAAAQIHISGSQRAGNGGEEHQNGCKSRFFHGDNVLLLGAQGFPHPFFYFFAGAALTFMTGGLIIPLMLPVMSVMIFFTVIGFWLTILPGSFYALQVIRMTYKAGKLSLGTAILHGILQLFFLADVLSAMYLATVKWKCAKKSSIAVGIVYIVCAIGVIVLAAATIKEFQGL